MSYKVLARRWRPTVFKELIGQEPVIRILTNSLQEKCLHPALIFAGPRGTGKTSCARILAKTLSCPQTKNSTPCNQCKTCEDINNSRSLDIIEIDGASNNGVEAVRDMKETINYSPTGPFKVYIIDEVHMLSVSAFNALLKTLEEPPPSVIFIMATTELRKIPNTVLSRCQILQFRQISNHLIYEQLKKICQHEKVTASDAAIWMLAREAQGSLRDAQGLLDQMMAFCQNKFEAQDVSNLLGLTDRSLLVKAISALIQRNSSEMLQLLDKLHIKGNDPGQFLKNLITELRHLLLLKLSTQDSSTDNLIPLSMQEKTELKELIQNTTPEDIHLLFDMGLKGSEEIAHIQDTKIYLEMLLLRMSQAPYIESLLGTNTEIIPPSPTNSEVRKYTPPAKPDEVKSDSTTTEVKTINTPSEKQQKTQKPSVIPATSTNKNTQEEEDIQNHKFVKKVQSTFEADILNTK